jgi:ketosteroid isomerase-like protein
MRTSSISRRTLLGAAACVLAAATTVAESARAQAGTGRSPQNEQTIRNYYAAWEKKDWGSLDSLLTNNFTFSSPVDDHISKSSYKTGCWDTQAKLIERFDLVRVIASGTDGFVMYVCHTKAGRMFHNVEYFRFTDGKVQAVECYFGTASGFPSAVNSKHS